MSKKYWWSCYGPFEPWDKCTSRPDPVEVLLFYLDRRGIEPEQRVAYAMKLLNLRKSMVYNLFKGEGLDSISRCRQLVQALKIHPPLLGIDGKYYPIEHHAYWWQAHGISLHADAQGYPIVSEVIVCLRMQRKKTEGGRVKVWSQSDLGEATGLTKETVYKMEHDKNPQILDSMTRRATLALALGALAIENESTLFRLFGLDPQAYGGSAPATAPIQVVHPSTYRLTDEILQKYHQQQTAAFTDYYTYHGEHVIAEALEWVKQSQAILSQANTTAQRVHILALQARYHDLTVGVAREQRKAHVITFHADRAVKLAERAHMLTTSGNPALLVTTNELLAAALLWRTQAYYELGHYDLAQADIDRALQLVSTLQSSQIRSLLLVDAGLIHAHTATSATDRQTALSYFDLAAHIIDVRCPEESGADENFMRCDKGMLYLRKAMALSAPQMKGATSETVDEILQQARQHANPKLSRRQTIIEVFQAQDYINAGEYEQATQVALIALEKSKQIRSRLNRDRIEELYQQLLNTSFRDQPLLARLGMQLRTWG